MATPVNYSHRANSGPSPRELQQLWEKLHDSVDGDAVSDEHHLRRSASARSWSSSRRYSASVWVGGSSIAQDARDKLRAADEARWRKVTANTIDGSPDWAEPALRLDVSELQMQDGTADERAGQHSARVDQFSNPVTYRHDDLQHILEGSGLSTTVKPAPAAQPDAGVSSQLQAAALSDMDLAPISSSEFNNVFFEDSSSMSPQTEATLSPTEEPTSAGTVYTADVSQTPTGDTTRKRTFVWDSTFEVSTLKRRQTTSPEIRSERHLSMEVDTPHKIVGGDGDNRCLLRTETFVERAPAPNSYMSTNNALPALSSFRPTEAGPQVLLGSSDKASQKLARVLTAPVELANPAMTEEPAWMRPMHLVDTGGKSIYLNAHDDGPIRHALCLWCFRTRGGFRKVHRHGYESCGRTEVLDSHYWEDDTWLDSSDDSTSSNC